MFLPLSGALAKCQAWTTKSKVGSVPFSQYRPQSKIIPILPPPPSCSPATSLRAAAAWWKKCYNCVCPLSNRNVRGSCLHRVCCFSAAAACPASSLIFQQAAASQQHHIASGQRKKRKKTAPPANLTSNGCLALAVACLSPTERKPPPSLCWIAAAYSSPRLAPPPATLNPWQPS